MMKENRRGERPAELVDQGAASLQIAEEIVATTSSSVAQAAKSGGENGSKAGDENLSDDGDDVGQLLTAGPNIIEEEYSDASCLILEQDRFLPIANISRIMKRVIPNEGKVAKDAKECCQECVSEFISFITSEASERCLNEKRKTINGEDLLFAMQNLGFDNYIEPLKIYLQKYRDAQKGEKSAVGNAPGDQASAAALLNAKPEEFLQLSGGSGENSQRDHP